MSNKNTKINQPYMQFPEKEFGMKEMIITIVIVAIFLLIVSFIIDSNKTYKNPYVDKSSEWYTNDLYLSDQYYYNNILNDAEKKLYKKVFDGINNFEKEITYDCDIESMGRAMDALICDHPELINFSGYAYTVDTIQINYLCNNQKDLNKKIKKVQKRIYQMSKSIDNQPNEYSTVKAIYEELAKSSDYGRHFDRSDQSAYTSFVKGKKTVCSGYAKSAQILLQTFGIKSHIIINESHVWNLVELDGEYYYFDTTNSCNKELDGKISYTGLNQNINNSSYESRYLEYFPQATGEKYYYYTYEGKEVVYNPDDLSNIQKILDESKKKKVEIYIKNYHEFEPDAREIIQKLNLRTIRFYAGYLDGCRVVVMVKR